MAISVGMGECPASPYLSLSLLSIPSLLLPPSFPSSFRPLSISLSSHTSSFGSPTPPRTPPPTFSQLGSPGHRSLSTPPPPTRILPPLPPPLPLHISSFSLRGCSRRCTLTARGYCVWKCSCWTRRPLQSTGQRLVHLCLRLGTFDPLPCSHFRLVTVANFSSPPFALKVASATQR